MKISELADWMKRYADHPGAQKIYDMAKKKRPAAGAAALAAPRIGRGVYGMKALGSGQVSGQRAFSSLPNCQRSSSVKSLRSSHSCPCSISGTTPPTRPVGAPVRPAQPRFTGLDTYPGRPDD
mgnify:CR=1 FL=1